MSVWEVLELDETNDLKVIKRAYAAKLKTVKPDEDPQGFQVLHQAYKTAQKIAKYNNAQESTGGIATQVMGEITGTTNINLHAGIEGVSEYSNINNAQLEFEYARSESSNEDYHNAPVVEEQKSTITDYQQVEQQELERLLDLVDELLLDDYKTNRIKNWSFITSTPYILDTEFNWQLGLGILKRLLDISNVQTHTLNYLNSLFNWKDDEEYICEVIGDEWCKTMLLRINNVQHKADPVSGLRGSKSVKKVKNISNERLNYYFFGSDTKRLIALFIDLMLLLFVVHGLFSAYQLVFGELRGLEVKNPKLILLFALYLIYAWYFEVSFMQSTPGKFILGIRVTNKEFKKVSKLRCFFRVILFAVTSAGSFLTIFINALLGGKYLHDRLSGTYVIDLRRSKKNHEKYHPEL